MSETEARLKRAEFDSKFRFRESRKSFGNIQVNCASCAHMTGVAEGTGKAHCGNPQRFKRVTLSENWMGADSSYASERVCDKYFNKQLPPEVSVPELPDKHVFVLWSQTWGVDHASKNCPYVVEEARMIHNGCERSKIEARDISDRVPREAIWQMGCEMPSCAGELNFQYRQHDDHKRAAGIGNNGSEPLIWIRKVVDHQRKKVMTPEEAEAFFDLSRFREKGDVYALIDKVRTHLYDGSNSLGSKPLSEAMNPVWLNGSHQIWEHTPLDSKAPLQFWYYDQRLFDAEKTQKVPIGSLDRVPEGFVLCVDTAGVLRGGMIDRGNRESAPRNFGIFGNVRLLEDKVLRAKGVTHFVDIGAVTYHDSNYMNGVYGRGVSAVASYDQE